MMCGTCFGTSSATKVGTLTSRAFVAGDTTTSSTSGCTSHNCCCSCTSFLFDYGCSCTSFLFDYGCCASYSWCFNWFLSCCCASYSWGFDWFLSCCCASYSWGFYWFLSCCCASHSWWFYWFFTCCASHSCNSCTRRLFGCHFNNIRSFNMVVQTSIFKRHAILLCSVIHGSNISKIPVTTVPSFSLH